MAMALFYLILLFKSTPSDFTTDVHKHTHKGDKGYCSENDWLESFTVIRRLINNGFHRELVSHVQCAAAVPEGSQVLLLEKLPQGVYVDPYQLTSAQEHSDTQCLCVQVLLASEIDLEAPAYLSSGFSALVYASLDPQCSGCFTTTLPVHARYHRPAGSGEAEQRVSIESPRLLVRAEESTLPLACPQNKVTEAPCTAQNHSLCVWLEIHYQQELEAVSLQIPVGDQRQVLAVCTGTLSVTLLCCCMILGAVWKHGHFQL
ncbi:phosphatidylinositol-glycan biosynthesis class X protein isoform X1 [Acipenser ruthenus]|uniref:phosphatidylinositol-glycan biosynthesis class X protein isoform X1 n=1 Tax=Acipenser ruthenus TaxID=7906 RepID=UPI00145A9E4A|nr:phosphatidylinositol-glycan biosynthesis class X protein isoform X1 [Acipenser ruthenus]XP_033894496.1 phosphatidylinositol-glycan biosynthesis class X protein isoform X1 [Acipenser ruthenus]